MINPLALKKINSRKVKYSYNGDCHPFFPPNNITSPTVIFENSPKNTTTNGYVNSQVSFLLTEKQCN